jgi:hypothetical protein
VTKSNIIASSVPGKIFHNTTITNTRWKITIIQACQAQHRKEGKRRKTKPGFGHIPFFVQVLNEIQGKLSFWEEIF